MSVINRFTDLFEEHKFFPYFAIALLAALSWGPYLPASFMNDDIQIIGITPPMNFFDIFAPFYKLNIWDIYWRPVTSLWLNLQSYFFGLNPLVFRASAFLVYFINCVLVYECAKRFGLDRGAALLSGMLFTVLPSHELNAGWISGSGDLLAAVFLILSLFGWLKFFSSEQTFWRSLLAPFFLLLLAMLSKELAYAGILLPFIAWIASGSERKKISQLVYSVLVSASLPAAILIYRKFVVGSDLFSAPHIEAVTLKTLVLNFLLYLPASIVTPDILEVLYYGIANPAVIILLAAIFGILFSALYLFIAGKNKVNGRGLFSASAWFLIFIVPVLPVFMRWYPFTASVGMVIIFGYLLHSAFAYKKLYYLVAPLALLIIAGYNFSHSLNWQKAGEFYKKQLAVISREVKESGAKDTMYLAGVPDKIARVAVMKLGINETIEYASGKRDVPNRAIVRCEIDDPAERVRVVARDSSRMVLELKQGRFIVAGMPSRAVLKNESAEAEEENFYISIETKIDSGNAISRAVIVSRNGFDLRKIITLSGGI